MISEITLYFKTQKHIKYLEEMQSDFGIHEIKNNKDPFNKTVR
jgi:hypothetical protein